jgi:hypothetical protein
MSVQRCEACHDKPETWDRKCPSCGRPAGEAPWLAETCDGPDYGEFPG